MPISSRGTAPTMPARESSGASATAQRAPRTPRSRSKALGSADHLTTLLSSRVPCCKGVKGKRYVIAFHAHDSTPDDSVWEGHGTTHLAIYRMGGFHRRR